MDTEENSIKLLSCMIKLMNCKDENIKLKHLDELKELKNDSSNLAGSLVNNLIDSTVNFFTAHNEEERLDAFKALKEINRKINEHY